MKKMLSVLHKLGYTDSDIREYALDRKIEFASGVSKLFRYHQELLARQRTLDLDEPFPVVRQAGQGRLL